MKTKSDKVYKGMVFAGCSFTWGQGLYYYSNLPTLKEPPPDAYNSNLVNHSHNAYPPFLISIISKLIFSGII